MSAQRRSPLPLRLSPVYNSELFSTHWLNRRLTLEPEWNELHDRAIQTLNLLTDLWREQKNRVEQYRNEQSLEQAFIQPVLEILGWKFIYQTHLRGRKPDYALFMNDQSLEASLDAGRLSPDFWNSPTVVADAKAWHVSLDRPGITGQQREYPPEQIEWYLNNSRIDYAFLTNGRFWRLIPREPDPGQPRFQTYFECDLAALLNERLSEPEKLFDDWHGFEDFFRFFLFFSPAAFASTTERASLIGRARSGSTDYRLGVGEELKQRVFQALRLCIEGFLSRQENALSSDGDVELCRTNSLILLYRLLFILYAEDRKLLPFGRDRSYTENRSLGRFRDLISSRLDRIEKQREPDYSKQECTLWSDLTLLFELVDEGAPRYKVPPYNGGLFDSEAHPFLAEKRLSDWYIARIIDQLGRAEDRGKSEPDLVRVDYRDLAIQHLGWLYEGLLELQPHFAHQTMVEVRSASDGQIEVIQEAEALRDGYELMEARYAVGSVYLQHKKDERRSSGSYYTPNHIVDYIVERTLGPCCDQIDKRLQREIAACEAELSKLSPIASEPLSNRLKHLRGAFPERVLSLRVLDPAMGSGHFLIRACQYLAEQIATNPNTRDLEAETFDGDESVINYWKRRVAEASLYGVDKNFMAVELAKLALWLETIAVSQPLTFLDHHLRYGDSLVGAAISDLGGLPDAEPLFAKEFQKQVESTVPKLLEAIQSISLTPSATVLQVKEKSRLFNQRFELMSEPFRQLADVWCTIFFLPEAEQISPQDYGAFIDALLKPTRFNAAFRDSPHKLSVELLRKTNPPFHWDLEFPEVFYTADGPRSDFGFDVIIGNPPYDVLSEKETGQDLSGLKRFLKYSPIFGPSFVGKNNLYKLFLCRSIDLMADEGRLGFIIPMPLLGDEQASGIRQLIKDVGTFTNLEVFPQKDDPSKRVFADAKLSTTIAIIRKTSSEAERGRSFSSRVHPADQIKESSSALSLTMGQLSLYDPSNLTIVSCSQVDWNLAVKIMTSGRFHRLGDACVSYQGEVNETNEKQAGSLSGKPTNGKQVLRGSNVCLYILREASQGDPLYLDESRFQKNKGTNSKAVHSREPRIGFQRSSPQNNFRRIVACPIPAKEYCLDTISYVPLSQCQIPPFVLLALLNSKLLDWYFRLGSTNSKVNEYQFNNLPCPHIANHKSLNNTDAAKLMHAIDQGRFAEAFEMLGPGMKAVPFASDVSDAIVRATERIIAIESVRGAIARKERSSLALEAQPYQDFIDRILFALAGLSEHQSRDLVERLETML